VQEATGVGVLTMGSILVQKQAFMLCTEKGHITIEGIAPASQLQSSKSAEPQPK